MQFCMHAVTAQGKKHYLCAVIWFLHSITHIELAYQFWGQKGSNQNASQEGLTGRLAYRSSGLRMRTFDLAYK
eukprot:486897-Pelagomonas_calceolata.AAC.2